MSNYVDYFEEIFTAKVLDLKQLGELFKENWLLKKSLSNQVSNKIIDEIYETAINAGASGGKILGAGGGGFILIYAKPIYHERIIDSLKSLVHVLLNLKIMGRHLFFQTSQKAVLKLNV